MKNNIVLVTKTKISKSDFCLREDMTLLLHSALIVNFSLVSLNDFSEFLLFANFPSLTSVCGPYSLYSAVGCFRGNFLLQPLSQHLNEIKIWAHSTHYFLFLNTQPLCGFIGIFFGLLQDPVLKSDFFLMCGCMVAQLVALLRYSKEVLGSNPNLGFLCMKFTCFPHTCVGSL